MQGCDFFVFQSTCENCPITLIEALGAGIPICCSSAGVMPEIAGKAVLYFDPRSPTSIAEALVHMARDADLRQRMGGMARVQARRFPTWQEMGALTLATLERVARDG
jgi:glycosyltransferase involved in cell wall biosynthesis